MILYINTIKNHYIEISLKDNDRVLAEKKFEAKYSQAERLLPEIEKLLAVNECKLKDVEKIEVENKNKDRDSDSSFTSVRVGIIIANALGYALGVPVRGTDSSRNIDSNEFDIIKPAYDGKPNINLKK